MRFRRSAGRIHTVLYNKWYVDEIYDFLFVNGLCKGGGTPAGRVRPQRGRWRRQRRRLADAFQLQRLVWWDTWIIDGAVRLGSFSVKMLSYPVRMLQTGRVQAYAFFVVLGVLAFFGYYVVR